MNFSMLTRAFFQKPFINGSFVRAYIKYEQYLTCDPPPSYKDIDLPEQRKLCVVQKIPHYYTTQKPPKLRRSHNDIRGPERIHNTLMHKQYGIIALTGGYMSHPHFEVLRLGLARFMDVRTSFAVWRIEPPWKPVVKKGIGKRMGGGKANFHHCVTPVKAGRVIIEMGGKVEFEEVKPLLEKVAKKMPFVAMVVSQEILNDLEKEARERNEKNLNPFTFGYAVKNNMQDCNLWTSPYDMWYDGKYF